MGGAGGGNMHVVIETEKWVSEMFISKLTDGREAVGGGGAQRVVHCLPQVSSRVSGRVKRPLGVRMRLAGGKRSEEGALASSKGSRGKESERVGA